MIDEGKLIQEILKPKQKDKAFKNLLDIYQERLYWHIRKLVITHENANDVLQNTFIRVYKNLPKFKQNSSLHTWMYRIAYNESMRFLEQNKKTQHNSIDDVNDKYLKSLIEDPFFEGNEAQIKLQKTLAKLPEKQRIVFQMKYYDELKFREISEIINKNENTIKTLYYTSVKFIKENIHQIELFHEKELRKVL